ncbi:MAG: THUMP domain-containing protein [Acidilobaceae archaeon]
MSFKPFNAIITHLPGPHVRWKIADFMRRTTGYFYIAEYTSNVILGKVRDPIAAAESLAASLTPSSPILRYIPVLEIRSPRLREVKGAIVELLSRQGEGSFAIRLDGHLEDEEGRLMSRKDAIVALADGIERRVDLENPDVLVYVKIVRFRGRWVAAVYVGSPKHIISVAKLPQ